MERFVTALGRRNELDPESLEDRGVDEGNLEPSEGIAQSVLAQVAVIVNKVVQKRCYIFPHFTKEFPSPKTVTAGIRSSWGFDNLLGAAYLQMWWLMTSGGDVTRCENCRRIMSLARTHPNGRKRRRDKRFCSDSCRQAHHRSKKRS